MNGVHLWAPDLSADSHSLTATAYIEKEGGFHLMVNAYWEPLSFALPDLPNGCGPWRRLIDTFQDSPSDFLEQEAETTTYNTAYSVQARSIVLMTTGQCGIETSYK